MQLLKEHSAHYNGGESHVWDGAFFNGILAAIVEAQNGPKVREEFATKYLKEYHDISVYTAMWLSYVKLLYDAPSYAM